MEVEVLDLSQKSISEKENSVPTPMDLSHKVGHVICVSDDDHNDNIDNENDGDEEEAIRELLCELSSEEPSAEALATGQKLMLQLGEQLRTEETIEMLLSQMKMSQRRLGLQNGGGEVKGNMEVVGSCESPSPPLHSSSVTQDDTVILPSNSSGRQGVPNISINSVVSLAAAAAMETGGKTQQVPQTQVQQTQGGGRMTREMAMQALDQQYMARKALLRKQADKSLSEIPLARPSQGALAQSDLNVVPSTTTNEFVALVGLEEVVKNVQEYRNVAMGQKPMDMKLVFTPFNCVQCGTDFTPLWKRERPGSSSVVCESCCSHNYRKAVQKDYQEKIKQVLKKYQDQERDLDRDYKDMLDSPKKFELFRKEQEKKLLAISNNGNSGRSSAPNNNNSSSTRSTAAAHHHQASSAVTSSSAAANQQIQQSSGGRSSVHRSSNISGSNSNRPITSSQQQYGQQQQQQQQPLRHQNSSNSSAPLSNTAASSASQLTVDQLAYMQMFQALNQLGSSTTMNPQATRQQQQLMQQILQMAYMSSASTLLGGSSNTTAANSFVQLLSNMAGLVSGGGALPTDPAATSAAAAGGSAASNTILNYYLSILQQQQQQSAGNNNNSSDK